MASTYVFLNNQLIGEYIGKPPKFSMPEGAYVCYGDWRSWYFKSKVSLIPINLSDIPKEVRAICLLMGIRI